MCMGRDAGQRSRLRSKKNIELVRVNFGDRFDDCRKTGLDCVYGSRRRLTTMGTGTIVENNRCTGILNMTVAGQRVGHERSGQTVVCFTGI